MTYFYTGSEERSESDRDRPHFWLLCCLQFDWLIDSGEICKYAILSGMVSFSINCMLMLALSVTAVR